jgi:protein-L-isoaspartate(D-aspartate) O-methyltransferase
MHSINRLRKTIVVLLLSSAAASCLGAETDWQGRRDMLVREIEEDVRATSSYTGKRELSPLVVESIRTVPRHEFVPAQYRDDAYLNRPLPIGSGQTISQPYIVALLTDLADVSPDSVVLEIGTGSGYQAAVLAEIVDHVYTIEIIELLGQRAEGTLIRLGYDNVSVRIGDGYKGWPEHAPFNAIIVTAAPEAVPEPLIEQLAIGGKLVIPVGPQYDGQSLQVLEKQADGTVTTSNVLPVRFVPFTRDE